MSKPLMVHWDTLYQGKVGAKYPFNGGRDGKWIKEWRAIYSDEDITKFMTAFFQMDDPFFVEAGWSLGCFRGCLPRVIAYVNRGGSVAVNWNKAPKGILRAIDRVREDGWDGSGCPHETTCSSLGICQTLQSMARRA
jgi:hypothetical protein